MREGRRGDGSEGGGRGEGREERRWGEGREERSRGRRREEVGGGQGEGYRLMRAQKLTLVGKELMYLRMYTDTPTTTIMILPKHSIVIPTFCVCCAGRNLGQFLPQAGAVERPSFVSVLCLLRQVQPCSKRDDALDGH